MRLLDVRRLDAFYGDFQALFGVDFSIDEGDAVAIIGANGAGKSTFLKAVAGLVSATADRLEYRGAAIDRRKAADIVGLGIAMVPEGRRLFPSLTVEENLLVGGHAERNGVWTLDGVYGLFPRLSERRNVPATSLSGGEQQMAAIGRALDQRDARADSSETDSKADSHHSAAGHGDVDPFHCARMKGTGFSVHVRICTKKQHQGSDEQKYAMIRDRCRSGAPVTARW